MGIALLSKRLPNTELCPMTDADKAIEMSEGDAAMHFGELPTPRDGETQDQACARILAENRAAGKPLPDPGTPLRNWYDERGRIHQIGANLIAITDDDHTSVE
jgi:hypothetical protein